MYIPRHFQETDTQRLFAMVEKYSFAVLVSVVDGAPLITHLPLLLDRERQTLLGHLANANPQVDSLFDGRQTLAVFQGPHAYISPRWYASPNVPTWNYVAVHAYGCATRLDDDGLADLLERLTASYETDGEPWRSALLPADRLRKMRGAITGFELPIERLEGKYKLNQNRSLVDREGAINAVRNSGHEELAQLMSDALQDC
ncbi:MAG: FMN-binding negative transcriptional regulator [Gammaproteobacteria bacterium]|nr:FMN-binding negative transcriptional regulator [Gammaproteobacteria bacterium]